MAYSSTNAGALHGFDRTGPFWVEPRLRALSRGTDAGITRRYLASQTSGYGLPEAPGNAYAYNEFALALCCDTLTRHVYKVVAARLKPRAGRSVPSPR